MNWFKFNKEKAAESYDFSFLGTDMHSHLIPGVDDGSPDIQTSIDLICKLRALGYSKIITTPHIMQGFYNNSPATILPGLKLLLAELEQLDIPVVIEAAAEYLLDTGLIDKLNADEPLMTLSGKKVLVELSFVSPPMHLHSLLYQLQLKGYEPVIAHPERYKYYHADMEQYKKLIDMGCKLQVNLLSFTGHYGKEVKKAALKLVDLRWPFYLGTDLHHHKHAEGLQSLLANTKLMHQLATYPWKNNTL